MLRQKRALMHLQKQRLAQSRKSIQEEALNQANQESSASESVGYEFHDLSKFGGSIRMYELQDAHVQKYKTRADQHKDK